MRAKELPTRSGVGPSDAALVLAVRAGEEWACEALFRRYAPMVNGLAYRTMGRDEDVDDLVQDVFVQALNGLKRLRDPQAFASWLSSIVVRTAAKTLRRRKLARRLGLRRDEPPPDADTLVGATAPPDVATELRAIYSLVDALPVEQRMALVLRRVEEFELEEIAAAMGLSLATVKRRLVDAEAALRRVMPTAGAKVTKLTNVTNRWGEK
jgi:RNA polymerase sigma-70 factor (ECF subfamily)